MEKSFLFGIWRRQKIPLIPYSILSYPISCQEFLTFNDQSPSRRVYKCRPVCPHGTYPTSRWLDNQGGQEHEPTPDPVGLVTQVSEKESKIGTHGIDWHGNQSIQYHGPFLFTELHKKYIKLHGIHTYLRFVKCHISFKNVFRKKDTTIMSFYIKETHQYHLTLL